jgi:hypothetical protein
MTDLVPPEIRFWRHVRKNAGCWEWTGGTAVGYGSFGINRRTMVGAHRFSWELHFGPIPPGLYVLHHCDNRLCVRPDHLFVGTARDNTMDMVRKGRHGLVRGEFNANAKLTRTQVEEIRATVHKNAHGIHGSEVGPAARKYGVTVATLRSVIDGRSYQ